MLQFKEIEHKFVVSDAFDLDGFRQSLTALGPSTHAALRVRDRYFLTEAGARQGFILRHRHDRDLHELTIKSVERDAEVRGEVNLALRPGDQDAQVDAFVAAQGVVWQGTVWKDLEVWHVEGCEVVHYVATAGERQVRCVEFEATHKPTMEEALAVLARFEAVTGFGGAQRTKASLLELMWPGVLAGRRLTP